MDDKRILFLFSLFFYGQSFIDDDVRKRHQATKESNAQLYSS